MSMLESPQKFFKLVFANRKFKRERYNWN